MGKEEEKEKKKKRIPRGRRNREPRDRLVKEKELNDEEDQVTNHVTAHGSTHFSRLIIRHTLKSIRHSRFGRSRRLGEREKCQNTAPKRTPPFVWYNKNNRCQDIHSTPVPRRSLGPPP